SATGSPWTRCPTRSPSTPRCPARSPKRAGCCTMPAPDPGRGPASLRWPVLVLGLLGLLGAAGLMLGWRYAVLPWYAGAVLAGLAVVGLVSWRGWSRWLHLVARSEEHTSELQSRFDLVCRLLLEKKKKTK